MKASQKVQQTEHDKDCLETMVRARTAELSELAAHLRKLGEQERQHLARQLHDDLGSLLTAAKLDLAYIKSKCAGSHPELAPKFDRIAAMLDQATALKRRLIDSLRPSTLDMLGLASAVRELVENFAAESRITIEATIDGEITIRNDEALATFRIIQEVLGNIRKFADASAVRVLLERVGNQLHLTVRDNGKGFEPMEKQHAAGHGLAAMRQQVHAMDGTLTLISAPGAGAEVEVFLPIRDEQ